MHSVLSIARNEFLSSLPWLGAFTVGVSVKACHEGKHVATCLPGRSRRDGSYCHLPFLHESKASHMGELMAAADISASKPRLAAEGCYDRSWTLLTLRL